ncbi:MAG: hypothetical protein CVV64_15380 [Candidatus Wallbacteria bacterium HGW-Wallbacteria-1]|jgi:signal transduction histidine kinase|uniref:histidine kinase n=1 Tax=Candidatus Wallbacteria bacterium HGW-Wallbacteria-1 TaxID=2013854 RepID=A0A2N1PLJ2_9BACT|nr:MAG: hypothetical protein CVV64_15380 [Candidatus Wallbacteria bacterium HGW-Wallbacteria-1]
MRSTLGFVLAVSLIYAASVFLLFSPLRNLGHRESALAGIQETIRVLSTETAHEVITKERILLTGNPSIMSRAWAREARVRELIRELSLSGAQTEIHEQLKQLSLVRVRFETVFREIAMLLTGTAANGTAANGMATNGMVNGVAAGVGMDNSAVNSSSGATLETGIAVKNELSRTPNLSQSSVSDHVAAFSLLSDRIFDIIGLLESIASQGRLQILRERAVKFNGSLRGLSIATLFFLILMTGLAYMIQSIHSGVFQGINLEVDKLREVQGSNRMSGMDDAPSGKVRTFINDLLDMVEFGKRERDAFTGRIRDAVLEAEMRLQADLSRLEEISREKGYVAEYYEGIVSSITDGLIVVEPDGMIVSSNRVALDTFGSDTVNEGINIREVFPGMDKDFDEALDEIAAGRSSRINRIRLFLNGGEGRFYSLKFYPSHGRGKQSVVGAAVVIEDISNLVVLENRVARSERLAALGQLSAGVAHEIKNPLAGMQVAIELALEKIENQLAQKEQSEQREPTIMDGIAMGTLIDVQKEIVRLDGIVDSLLDFARPASREGFSDAAEVVARALRFMDSSFCSASVNVAESIKGPCLCHVDETRLSQVILNLLVNAMEAMDRGGTITVDVQTVEKEILISVSDTGCGLAPEQLSRIFDPFFTTKSGGTGLGLSISYNIMRDVGGHISVESDVGNGSRFTVRIPGHNG